MADLASAIAELTGAVRALTGQVERIRLDQDAMLQAFTLMLETQQTQGELLGQIAGAVAEEEQQGDRGQALRQVIALLEENLDAQQQMQAQLVRLPEAVAEALAVAC